MKKVFIFQAILLLFLMVGCKKETTNQSNELNSKSRAYIEISGNEYDALKNSLENDFSQSNNKSTKSITKEDMLKQDVAKMPTDNIHPLDLSTIVKQNEAIIAKYSILNNFTSMLSIYNKALLIKEKVKLKQFTEKYNTFLVYFEEFNYVMLKVPVYKAALLSPQGIIKIDNQIRKYDEFCIKVIKDGDDNKICQFDNTNESTKNISVFNFNKSKTIVWANSTVIYNPNSSLYSVALVHYVDNEYWTDYTDWNKFTYSAGANAATFFNGQACGVTVFNLNSTSTYPLFTQVPNYHEYYGPQYNQRNILYAQTNFTKNTLVMDVFYISRPIVYRDLPSFISTTNFGVMYSNNVVFYGSWVK